MKLQTSIYWLANKGQYLMCHVLDILMLNLNLVTRKYTLFLSQSMLLDNRSVVLNPSALFI